MSAIFLSHSSQDNDRASDVKAWLEQQGHRSIFLDFDPENGIPAGRSWEKELYQRLRACRAVIVLCSEHSMSSRWCFAEITHARSLGKHIFPVKISATEIDSLLNDLQVIDYTADSEEALIRLGQGLEAAGVDTADPFDWDGSRPPYPGLMSFQEEDAAIFFGRDQEIGRGLDQLNQMHRYGGASLLLLLGASGSGKSSLMRAGMLPRLRRAGRPWLIVDPFRPADDPEGHLAAVLAQAFQRTGRNRSWRQVQRELHHASEYAASSLTETLRELRLGSEQSDATVLLFIDQFEELLGQDGEHPANRFLFQLRAAIEAEATSLLIVATVRSDFLGVLQKHPALSDVPFRDLSLTRIPHNRLPEIIERPAELASVDLDPKLVQALLADTTAEDTLPLLAFTLRELWELWHEEKSRLGPIHYYDRLGGLQGSVGRAADNVLATGQLTGEDEDRLRSAFLGMVRVDQDGHYARRAISWQKLSPDAHEWLERFVKARLLVSGGAAEQPTLEVAHEALFVAWVKLQRWLEENREVLLVRRELAQASKLWHDAGRQDDDLWRGGRLHRALELCARAFDHRRRQPATDQRSPAKLDEKRGEQDTASTTLPLSRIDSDFLDAAQAEAERVQCRQQTRRRAIITGAFGFGLVCLGFLLWALFQKHLTDIQASRVLALQAYSLHESPDLALLLGLEAQATQDSFEGRSSLASLLGEIPQLEAVLDRQQAKIHSLAINTKGTVIAAAGDEGILSIIDLRTGETRELGHGHRVLTLAFAPGSDLLMAAGGGKGDIHLWDTRAGTLTSTVENRLCSSTDASEPATVNAVAFDPSRRQIAAADANGWIRIWDQTTGRCLFDARGHYDNNDVKAANALQFSPSGDLLASGGDDGFIQLWRTTDGLEPTQRLTSVDGSGRVRALAFKPDGSQLASASSDGKIRLWDVASNSILKPWLADTTQAEMNQAEATALAFSPDGQSLAAARSDGVIQLWDVDGEKILGTLTAHAGEISSLVFAGSKLLTSAGTDQKLRLWRLDSRLAQLDTVGHPKGIRAMTFSPDGRLAASGGGDETVMIWDIRAGQQFQALPYNAEIASLAFAPNSATLAVGGRDGVLELWDVSSQPAQSQPVVQPQAPNLNYIWDVAFAPDGERLAAACAGSQVLFWQGIEQPPTLPPVPTQIAADKKRARRVIFDPTGHRLVAGIGRTLLLWDLSACNGTRDDCVSQPILIESANTSSEFMALAFSSDGQQLFAGDVIGGAEGGIHRWDLSDQRGPKPLPSLPGHDFQTRVLLPDIATGFLFSAGGDNAIRLWNLADGESLIKLSGHQQTVHALALSDGILLSASEDRTIRSWRLDQLLDIRLLERRACQVANRDLSISEWNQFIGANKPYSVTCKRKWTGLPQKQ